MSNLVARLRARINQEAWVPGKYPSLDEELLAYVLALERDAAAKAEKITDMSWRLDTTRWGQ